MIRLLALALLVAACASEPTAPTYRVINFSNRSTEQVHITIPDAYDTYVPGLTGTCGVLDAPIAARVNVTIARPAVTQQLNFAPNDSPHWQIQIFADSLILIPLASLPC